MKGNDRDDILDRALAAYSAQEPLSGLEERVLARVLAASATPRFGRPRWVLAVAAAAAALFFVVALGVYRKSSPPPQTAARDVGQALSPANSAAAQVGRRKRLPHVVDGRHTAQALPKLQQFPTPAPLTQAERALLAFVNQAPDEAQKVALEQEQADVPPIQIEAIQIEPLHIDGLPEEQ